MKTIRIIDSYNSNKVWIVRIYQNLITYNQEIEKHILNKKYVNTTKGWLKQVLPE